MISWLNFVSMLFSSLLCLLFYIKSAGPAALEKIIGKKAYYKATQYRIIASIFMTICAINYVIYYFYPLPLPIPKVFPWDLWISISIAVLISIPSGYLLMKGMKDAGEETIFVKREHQLYGGIYEKIRHPQAVGELPFWWVFAFLLHSPFLVLYSFIWVPIFYLMCLAEEKDLEIRYGIRYIDYKRRTGFIIPKKSK